MISVMNTCPMRGLILSIMPQSNNFIAILCYPRKGDILELLLSLLYGKLFITFAVTHSMYSGTSLIRTPLAVGTISGVHFIEVF